MAPLVEFSSVVDALRCATEMQAGMAQRNTTVPADKCVEFRVGIRIVRKTARGRLTDLQRRLRKECSMNQATRKGSRRAVGRVLGGASAALLFVAAIIQPEVTKADDGGDGSGGFHGMGGGFHSGGFH